MLTLPATPSALVLRTDFSADAAWEAVCAASSTISPEGFGAGLSFVSDHAFAGLTVEKLVGLPSAIYRRYFFVVDDVTINSQEMPLLVVELSNVSARRFRVIPALMWSVENNFSQANMDFEEFARSVDQDGVYRGFS